MAQVKLNNQDITSLARIVGSDHVSGRDLDRLVYSRDDGSRSLIQWRQGRLPWRADAIVWPANTQEVQQLVRWAGRRRIPVIAYGGGSGVSGGTLPLRGGLILDLKRMNALESIDPAGPSAIVESGIVSSELESQLGYHGYTLGHFPSSIHIATHGGCLATRGAGQLSSKYGKIEDMVEAIEVVLPNGALLPMGAKQVPGLAGYDPVPLFIGSEGVLGVVTRSQMRLHPVPQACRYRAFSFVRLKEAFWAIRTIMQLGLKPSVIRLYDPLDSLLLQWGYERGLNGGGVTRWLEPLLGRLLTPLGGITTEVKRRLLTVGLSEPALLHFFIDRLPSSALLILGFEGDPQVIACEEKEVTLVCKRVLSRDEGEEIAKHWLKHRYSVSYKMPQIFSAMHFVDTIEVATTWDRLNELYSRVRKALTPYCLVLAHFSHAYPEGCSIYFTVVAHEKSVKQELALHERIWDSAMEACLKAGGTISHHHGVGALKASYMKQELGAGFQIIAEAKKMLDPYNIMNPGKLGL